MFNLCCCSCSRVVCTCPLVTDRDLENLLRVKKHERGNKTSRTPCSTLTVTIHGTTGVDLSRYQLHAWLRSAWLQACGVCMDGGRCFQSRVDTIWWHAGRNTIQSAKEILRGSLVEQVVPAEYVELTLMNVSAEQAFSMIELHEHLNSSHFPGSFGTIENPTLVSAILNDEVVGCGGGSGEAEHVPHQFHCKEGFLDRSGEREQIFMLPCVIYSLLGNAVIDLVDLYINEAGMRLSLRITIWSEAGERLRSRVASWSGKTCTAGTDSALRRVCPKRGNFGGSHGCHELPHSAVGAAQDRMDQTVVSVEDADLEAETILDLDAVVMCSVCCWLRAGRCDGDNSFQTSRTRRELRSSMNLVSVKRMATTVLRSCRRT